ncbi:hypothetical protein F4780DRAFT_774574 [Xylariomycetidae sp. FL0641]|nr:hypothetical protein F4780DRAFT_774574 [Xylariomycetidae sp. FL0641]
MDQKGPIPVQPNGYANADYPPPYVNADPKMNGGGGFADSAGTAARGQRQFPLEFCLYKSSSLCSRNYVLGAHQSSPQHAVSLHTGYSGQADVVLHASASKASPALATADRDGKLGFGRSSTITLPGAGVRARLEAAGHLFQNPTLTFAVAAAAAPGGETETLLLQWRHSRGDAVRALGGRGRGWKLVRLQRDGGESTGGGGGGPTRSARDGAEVVAVWAGACMSLTKALHFRFLGALADGSLGAQAELMAVITALKIWDMEVKQRRAAASSAGGGGGGGG